MSFRLVQHRLLAPRAVAHDAAVDPRKRLWALYGLFLLGLLALFARRAQLEWSYGDRYRTEAARPLERRIVVPAPRGRILSREGLVLAEDVPRRALAVHYRYLQRPPHPAWLRSQARRALPAARRRDPAEIAAEMARQTAMLDDLHQRLAALAGVSLAHWQESTGAIQARVERIAASVRERRRRRWLETVEQPEQSDAWPVRVSQWLGGQPRHPLADWDTLVVAEELDAHVVVPQVGIDVLAEIEAHPQRWPGVEIVEQRRRRYPAGSTAPHVVGLAGDSQRTGLEQAYDATLRGHDGLRLERTDSTGRVLEVVELESMQPGQDVVLSLDLTLQRNCERLLDAALARRDQFAAAPPPPSGGAAVVLDVRSGAVLALATAPRFDPAIFNEPHAGQAQALLDDPRAPLVNRATQMAIPPGSVFKLVTAAALLSEPEFDPRRLFDCQGYLERPDRQRCAIFVRRGVGHGPTDLTAALGQSCNTYFFHHARGLDPDNLADWARRFGLASPTGIDLPDEAAGQVPRPELGAPGRATGWSSADTAALAIGQSTLAVTPLAVARMMAAIANGGRLVEPHLVRGQGISFADTSASRDDVRETIEADATSESHQIAELDAHALGALNEGLRAAVNEPSGTAHATLADAPASIAGKTGTAEVGGSRDDHAWFAGLVPAEKPRVAIVVVLEHAGDGGQATGPVVRRIVETLVARGLVPARNRDQLTAHPPEAPRR
ncbi:MAG: hypothetical protein K1X74_01490 [Pirellulales bacterium]|nr:hypothetical protein [Pirellulales bacterium]